MGVHAAPETKQESLSDRVSHMLEECRMVLPGIQALFGFQLIAVFNSTFWEKLVREEQIIHFISILLVVIAVALVMTPAAYHRQAEPNTVSQRLVSISSRLLSWSMYPLMAAILLDCYIIGKLILKSSLSSAFASGVLLCIFTVLWILLPRLKVLQYWLSGSR